MTVGEHRANSVRLFSEHSKKDTKEQAPKYILLSCQPRGALGWTLLCVPPPRASQHSHLGLDSPPWLHWGFCLSPLVLLQLQSTETIADNLLGLFSKTGDAMTLRNYLFPFHHSFSCSKTFFFVSYRTDSWQLVQTHCLPSSSNSIGCSPFQFHEATIYNSVNSSMWRRITIQLPDHVSSR